MSGTLQLAASIAATPTRAYTCTKHARCSRSQIQQLLYTVLVRAGYNFCWCHASNASAIAHLRLCDCRPHRVCNIGSHKTKS